MPVSNFQGITKMAGLCGSKVPTWLASLFDGLDNDVETRRMLPTAAVSGYYFAHPEAAYFGVARIGRDQVEDYARRRGVAIEQAEKWLRPNIGY